MEPSLTIFEKGLVLPEPVRDYIRERADRLAHFHGRILRTRVVVEGPGQHHRQGRYRVQVRVEIPGPDVLVNRRGDEDPVLAVSQAFDAAGRRLEDVVRRRRGFVKSHPEGR
jgi:ribosome-associated translation inhibitor RaiA